MRPNKLMGQHFLSSRHALGIILETARPTKKDIVLEVGPGTGILTRELGERARKVIAVEKDPRLVEYLAQEYKAKKNVDIVEGDILRIPKKTLKLKDNSFIVVANIPYYLTSRFLRIYLECAPRPRSMTLMIQHEVARRITARPPDMNLLALSVQAFGTPSYIAKIPRGAFHPAPRVDSAIIHIAGINDSFFKKNNIRPKTFFEIAKKAFSQKRKMLKRSIGADSQKRPEELSLGEWVEIIKSR